MDRPNQRRQQMSLCISVALAVAIVALSIFLYQRDITPPWWQATQINDFVARVSHSGQYRQDRSTSAAEFRPQPTPEHATKGGASSADACLLDPECFAYSLLAVLSLPASAVKYASLSYMACFADADLLLPKAAFVSSSPPTTHGNREPAMLPDLAPVSMQPSEFTDADGSPISLPTLFQLLAQRLQLEELIPTPAPREGTASNELSRALAAMQVTLGRLAAAPTTEAARTIKANDLAPAIATHLLAVLQPLDISKIQHLVSLTESFSAQFQGKQMFLFFGATGAGKTTTCLYLAGCTMASLQDADNVSYIGASSCPREGDSSLVLPTMTVGTTSHSETRYVSAFPIAYLHDAADESQATRRDGSATGYVGADPPGFADTEGIAVEIANSIGIARAAGHAKSVVPILVVDGRVQMRGASIKKSLQSAASFINLDGDEHALARFKFIVSHCTTEEAKRAFEKFVRTFMVGIEKIADNNYRLLFKYLFAAIIEEEVLYVDVLSSDPYEDVKRLLEDPTKKRLSSYTHESVKGGPARRTLAGGSTTIRKSILDTKSVIQFTPTAEVKNAVSHQCSVAHNAVMASLERGEFALAHSRLADLDTLHRLFDSNYPPLRDCIRVANEQVSQFLLNRFETVMGTFKKSLQSNDPFAEDALPQLLSAIEEAGRFSILPPASNVHGITQQLYTQHVALIVTEFSQVVGSMDLATQGAEFAFFYNKIESVGTHLTSVMPSIHAVIMPEIAANVERQVAALGTAIASELSSIPDIEPSVAPATMPSSGVNSFVGTLATLDTLEASVSQLPPSLLHLAKEAKQARDSIVEGIRRQVRLAHHGVHFLINNFSCDSPDKDADAAVSSVKALIAPVRELVTGNQFARTCSSLPDTNIKGIFETDFLEAAKQAVMVHAQNSTAPDSQHERRREHGQEQEQEQEYGQQQEQQESEPSSLIAELRCSHETFCRFGLVSAVCDELSVLMVPEKLHFTNKVVTSFKELATLVASEIINSVKAGDELAFVDGGFDIAGLFQADQESVQDILDHFSELSWVSRVQEGLFESQFDSLKLKVAQAARFIVSKLQSTTFHTSDADGARHANYVTLLLRTAEKLAIFRSLLPADDPAREALESGKGAFLKSIETQMNAIVAAVSPLPKGQSCDQSLSASAGAIFRASKAFTYLTSIKQAGSIDAGLRRIASDALDSITASVGGFYACKGKLLEEDLKAVVAFINTGEKEDDVEFVNTIASRTVATIRDINTFERDQFQDLRSECVTVGSCVSPSTLYVDPINNFRTMILAKKSDPSQPAGVHQRIITACLAFISVDDVMGTKATQQVSFRTIHKEIEQTHRNGVADIDNNVRSCLDAIPFDWQSLKETWMAANLHASGDAANAPLRILRRRQRALLMELRAKINAFAGFPYYDQNIFQLFDDMSSILATLHGLQQFVAEFEYDDEGYGEKVAEEKARLEQYILAVYAEGISACETMAPSDFFSPIHAHVHDLDAAVRTRLPPKFGKGIATKLKEYKICFEDAVGYFKTHFAELLPESYSVDVASNPLTFLNLLSEARQAAAVSSSQELNRFYQNLAESIEASVQGQLELAVSTMDALQPAEPAAEAALSAYEAAANALKRCLAYAPSAMAAPYLQKAEAVIAFVQDNRASVADKFERAIQKEDVDLLVRLRTIHPNDDAADALLSSLCSSFLTTARQHLKDRDSLGLSAIMTKLDQLAAADIVSAKAAVKDMCTIVRTALMNTLSTANTYVAGEFGIENAHVNNAEVAISLLEFSDSVAASLSQLGNHACDAVASDVGAFFDQLLLKSRDSIAAKRAHIMDYFSGRSADKDRMRHSVDVLLAAEPFVLRMNSHPALHSRLGHSPLPTLSSFVPDLRKQQEETEAGLSSIELLTPAHQANSNTRRSLYGSIRLACMKVIGIGEVLSRFQRQRQYQEEGKDATNLLNNVVRKLNSMVDDALRVLNSASADPTTTAQVDEAATNINAANQELGDLSPAIASLRTTLFSQLEEFTKAQLAKLDNVAAQDFDAMANTIVDLYTLSQDMTCVQDTIRNRIGRSLEKMEFSDPGGVNKLTLKILQHPRGNAVMTAYPCFKGALVALRNTKLKSRSLDAILSESELVDPEPGTLTRLWTMFSPSLRDEIKAEAARVIKEIDDLIFKYMTGNPSSMKDLVHATRSLVSSVRGDRAVISREAHEKMPEIIAHVTTIWTLQCGQYYFKAKDNAATTSKAENYIIRPHNGQIITILRMLQRIDSSEHPLGLRNNFCELGTGEGKSVVLATTAAILAMFGMNVKVACYSTILSTRDYSDFEFLISSLGVSDQIMYGTFAQVSEALLNQQGSARDLVQRMIMGVGQASSSSGGDEATAGATEAGVGADDAGTSNAGDEGGPGKDVPNVLLMDEVDVFLNKEFYGRMYQSTTKIQDPAVTAFVKFLWGKRSQTPTFAEIEATTEYQALVARFADWEELVKSAVLSMLVDLVDFEGHTYVLEDRKIGYKDQDTIVYNIRYGYKTMFASIFEAGRDRVAAEHMEESIALYINSGAFSYAEIPKQFDLRIGVTGTLKATNELVQDIISTEYNVKHNTIIASAYGKTKRVFAPRTDVVVADDSMFGDLLVNRIKALVDQGRAAIILFKSTEELDAFLASEAAAALPKYQMMTPTLSASDRATYTERATRKHAVTFATPNYGRGVDFVCNDKEVNIRGGVEVISTFMPLDVAEEIQFQGRTARAGEYGSFYMLLREGDLESIGVEPDDVKQHRANGDLYEYLRAKATEQFTREYEQAISFVASAKAEHERSMAFLQALRRHDVAEVRSALEAANPPPARAGASRIMFLIDGTLSMSSLLAATKAKVIDVFQRAEELLAGQRDFTISIAIFRNYNAGEGLLEISPWTSNVQEVIAFMDKIHPKHGMGREALEVGFAHVNEEIEKAPIDSVVLIGDAAANTRDEVLSKRKRLKAGMPKFATPVFADEELKALVEKGVKINAFYLASRAKEYFEEVSSQSGGVCHYLNVDAPGGTKELLDLVTQAILSSTASDETMTKEVLKQYHEKYGGKTYF